MKKIILALITVTALGLAGCQAKPNTQGIQDQMTSAIAAKQYGQAAGLNQAILKLNQSDTAASKRAKQFTQLLKAQAQFDQNHFNSAKLAAAKVAGGNQQLSQAADQLESKAAKCDQQQAALKKQLNNITQLRDSDPSTAQSKLKTLLAGQTIKLSAFKSLRINALQLQNELLTSAASSTQPTATSSSADNTSASSTSASASSASSASAQPEGQPVSGSESITDADIAKARQEIKAAGEDPTYFSDNDVRNAIMKARAAGRTVVQASDWQ